jgi:PH domain
VESLQQEAKKRGKLREEVLRLLTTASEELDALPEELTSSLNKLLHEINKADSRTAELVTIDDKDNVTLKGGSRSEWQRLYQMTRARKPMSPNPLEAQRIPVNLGTLRKKLGEISLTTLLRIRNMSDQSLRLKSGVQLKEGRYVKELKTSDPDSHEVIIYHLYPISEIPPRTEVVIAARSNGAWLATSGVDGEIVYTCLDETWRFRISFCSGLINHNRKCHVEAVPSPVSGSDSESGSASDTSDAMLPNHNPNEVWQISREELDRKANSEFLILIDVHTGQAAQNLQKSCVLLKSGYLMKNKSFGLRLQWKQRWVTLNATEIIYCDDVGSGKKNSIPIKHIKSVKSASDIVHAYVFEIELNSENPDSIKFAASSLDDRDSWIHAISSLANLNLTNEDEHITSSIGVSSASARSWKGDIECVQLDDMETKVISC